VWREIGGPTVAASPNYKYGVSIIRDLIPNELGGSVELAFAASGVSCKIEIPLGVACAETGRPAARR
jgi:two-component sensor histidine kinase